MKRREFIQQAAAIGLFTSADWQRLLAAPIVAAEVRGHVVAEQQPLEGVQVSDGYRVVSTDASGQFTIPVGPDSGPFLFVSLPAGYWSDQFYLPTSSAIATSPIFRLKARPEYTSHTAIYLTDIHLGEGRADQSYSRFQATVEEINSLDPLPAFCWAGGDITLQGGKGERYVELMSRLKVPVRNAVGNHEMLVAQPDPREQFQRLFGPTYYSFNVGQVHYVTLDGCQVNTQAEGYRNVEGRLSARELHWLAEDLRRVPDGMARVVSIHIPLVSDYPARRGTTAEQAPYWVIQNADEVVDLLARHGVSLVLQGHLHENQRLTRQGIEFVESISVSGRWWKAPVGAREHGVSGEPRGYRVLEMNGSSVRHRYQSSAESQVDGVGEIVGLPATLAAGKDIELPINVYDGTPHTIVSARIDDAAFEPLQQGSAVRYHENLVPVHHWTWKLRADQLAAGSHKLEVHVREPGQAVQSIEQRLTVG